MSFDMPRFCFGMRYICIVTLKNRLCGL